MKRTKIRHAEYFGMIETQDNLFKESKNNHNFYKLIELMNTDENIRLAFRNIKRNSGSKTSGIDGLTIEDIEKMPLEEVISNIRRMFEFYQPSKVRRVFIPKNPQGDVRPLGIPVIWDRLFQQCILQILEPICEAKFHPHSYGFRPDRGTRHAIARMNHRINKANLHFCIDIDIKGFFDNVNHGKLLKQMWSMGIRDKRLISIISKLLKAEIDGEGIPNKGTPQGGILSPLLSNIVLNELDWWVSDQWETFETRYDYTRIRKSGNKNRIGEIDISNKFRALKTSNLKECYLIRYADDFKIMCRTYQDAKKMFAATVDFLETRLKLNISPEKSKIVNLRKKHSEFLGIKTKAIRKGVRNKQGKRRIVISHTSNMTDKALEKANLKLREAISKVSKQPRPDSVRNLNSVIRGIQNYYSCATLISQDLSLLNHNIHNFKYNRLRRYWKDSSISNFTPTQKKRYKGYNPKLYSVAGVVIEPIYARNHDNLMCFNQNISRYTREGRILIHDKLKGIDTHTLEQIRNSYVIGRSIEYNDNRISKFVAQHGNCALTKLPLGKSGWHCHHIKALKDGGNDSFSNLIIILEDLHRAIHMVDVNKIKQIVEPYNLDSKARKLFDKLRQQVNRKPFFTNKKGKKKK